METLFIADAVSGLSSENISSWDFVQVDHLTRLYYNPHGEGNGFHFYAAEATSVDSGKEWWIPETGVECLFEGVAYFDGVRHLYMGSEKTDNYGYLNYPKIERLTAVLQRLRELELKYCNSLD